MLGRPPGRAWWRTCSSADGPLICVSLTHVPSATSFLDALLLLSLRKTIHQIYSPFESAHIVLLLREESTGRNFKVDKQQACLDNFDSVCDGLGTADSATRLDAPIGDVEHHQTTRCRSCYISDPGGTGLVLDT
ncbi:hypothetical protein ACET3X_002864 [Alternaria dauci]|uniref:Uncharacterized protein n=1 Tax=Alternaria dauci TaxID=48095 RepID=A0ABR3UR96_9PLEO